MNQYTAPRRVYCTPSKVQKRVFLILHVVWHSKAPRHPIWRGDLGSLLDPFQWLHSALPDLLLSLPLRPPPPTKPFRPLSVSHIMFRRQSKSSQVYSERREGFLFFHEKNSQIPHQKVSNYAHKTATPPSPFFSFPPHFQILQTCTNIYNPFGGQARPLNPSPPFAQLLLPFGKWIGAQYFCGTEVPRRSRSTQQRWAFRAAAAAANLGHVCLLRKALPFLNYTRNGSPALYVRNAHLRTYVGSSRRRRKWKGGEGALIKKSLRNKERPFLINFPFEGLPPPPPQAGE